MFKMLISVSVRQKTISFLLSIAVLLSFGLATSTQANPKSDKKRKKISTKSALLTSDRGEKGEWNVVSAFTSPLLAAHVSVLPNGKLISWGTKLGGTNYDQTYVQVWNPDAPCPPASPDPNNPCIEGTLLPTSYENLFCSGHSFLPDGNLLVTGGTPLTPPTPGSPYQSGIANAALYNYLTGTWTQLPQMNARRWYPTNAPLGDGSALVWGGYNLDSSLNDVPQVLEKQANGTYTWRSLNIKNPESAFQYYSWLNTLSSGKVLATVGVQAKSYLVTMGGTFRYPKDFLYKYPLSPTNSAYDGQLHDPHDAGTQIVYDKDQFVVIGGGSDYPKETVEVLNANNSVPEWQKVGKLNIRRRHHNSTILPDGKVLVTGGNKGNAFNNTCPQNAVKEAEMWDPSDPGTADETGKWKLLAPATEARLYHSAAVLMPDGRVFTGGTWAQSPNGNVGNRTPPNPACTASLADNFTIEMFSPPYLFNADGSPATRPVITGAPTTAKTYGDTFSFNVTNAGSGSKVTLVRLPSVTHSFNQNQGFFKLTPTISGQTFSVTLPGNRNELVPGHYMMFVINSAGVPSVSKIIQVL